MPTAFSTTILLKSPASLTEAGIGQALRAVAPGFVKALEITSANAESYIVKLNDVPAVIMALPAPAPGFSDYKSDGPNLLWPSVEADLARHKAHVMVICPTEANNRDEAIGYASIVTFITAAILKLTAPIGVYWPAGENFVTADTFLTAAEGYARGEGPPVMAWLRLYAEQDKTGIVVSTHGLKHFAGREIDIAPSQKQLGELLTNVLATSSYLIQSGVVFKEGETLGPENEALFSIALRDVGRLKDGPVYVLAPPKAPLGKKN